MIALIPILILAAAAQSDDNTMRYSSPELAAAHVKACGFKHVRIVDDEEVKEEVIVVSHLKNTTDSQLRCAAQQSLDFFAEVEFPAALKSRYQRVYSEVEWAAARGDARAWLEGRGLLAKLPAYEKGKTDDLEFARKIESLCGPRASGVLLPLRGMMTIGPWMLEKPALDDETSQCLVNVSVASGIRWGIVAYRYAPPNRTDPPRE